ncbi:MAG: hypothetical protein ACI9JU_001814 [Pseudohongiellaceae bacterium]
MCSVESVWVSTVSSLGLEVRYSCFALVKSTSLTIDCESDCARQAPANSSAGRAKSREQKNNLPLFSISVEALRMMQALLRWNNLLQMMKTRVVY